jgi:hypothetical protein
LPHRQLEGGHSLLAQLTSLLLHLMMLGKLWVR